MEKFWQDHNWKLRKELWILIETFAPYTIPLVQIAVCSNGAEIGIDFAGVIADLFYLITKSVVLRVNGLLKFMRHTIYLTSVAQFS